MRTRAGSFLPPGLVVTLVAAAFLAPVSANQPVPAPEYEVKAGFLYNFARFVTWPDSAFRSESEDLRLEVIGHDSFDGALDRLVAGKMINRHKIVVLYADRVSGGSAPHMVFVSASERKRATAILSQLRGAATLTVSDIAGFAESGGIIGLFLEKQAVHFAVNRAVAGQARLRISSRILSLATLVGPPPSGPPPSGPPPSGPPPSGPPPSGPPPSEALPAR